MGGVLTPPSSLKVLMLEADGGLDSHVKCLNCLLMASN